MSALSARRLLRPAGAAVLLAAALTMASCAAEPVVESAAPSDASAPSNGAVCEGVRVVVDFGELGEPGLDACADTDETVTALEAFNLAGVTLTEGEAFPGSICRIDGAPAADLELSYSGETHTEDCVNMGPVWAYWGLFLDAGTGWEYAQKGVAEQPVEPGQSIAFAWQFGDTAEPQLPTA